jgi:hypothetical protein
LRFLLLLSTLFASLGLARSASAACEAGAPHVTFSDGRPLVHATGSYGTASCPEHEVVDVTYGALGTLPGTYASWAATDPGSEVACTSSRLSGDVWDMSSSPPVFKGNMSSTGVWVANRDPSNPNTGACQIAPLRFENRFSFTSGRKYRFALRAYRLKQKGGRDLVFANAPLPAPGLGCAVLNGPHFCAVLASSGATSDSDRWPTSSYRLRLESPTMRVLEGGDIFFQDGSLFQPHRTYANSRKPNFGYSNAALLYRGGNASVDAFTCPDFTMLEDRYAAPEYSYLDQARESTTSPTASYCVLTARNNAIYRMRVERRIPSVIIVSFRFDRNTGRAAWGCLDGMCDADVRVASQYMRYTTTERDNFVRRQFELLHQSRYCIEGAFQRVLPVPLSMDLHGERMLTDASDSWIFGLGGDSVLSVGFQGLHRAGTNRIEDARDIRFELHESMHAYNANLFAADLPSWLNEGLSIQANRLDCDGSPDYLRDVWRTWSPGNTSGHAVGSEFFMRLETQYGCDVDCAYGLWRALIDNLGTDTSITNFKVKRVLETALGVSLTSLFGDLAIPYPIAGP